MESRSSKPTSLGLASRRKVKGRTRGFEMRSGARSMGAKASKNPPRRALEGALISEEGEISGATFAATIGASARRAEASNTRRDVVKRVANAIGSRRKVARSLAFMREFSRFAA